MQEFAILLLVFLPKYERRLIAYTTYDRQEAEEMFKDFIHSKTHKYQGFPVYEINGMQVGRVSFATIEKEDTPAHIGEQ